MSTGITAARYEERLGRAAAAVGGKGHAALLIGVGPELEWLIGYAAVALERLTMLVIPASGRATLVVPRLEQGAASAAPGTAAGLVEVATWGETDDPCALVARIVGAAGATGSLLVSDGLRAAFLLRLQAALPGARFAVASALVSPLRQVKDAEEIVASIPSRFKMKGMKTKVLLRAAMADVLPAETTQGPKQGFNVPIPSWLTGPLREMVHDTLSPSRIAATGIFRPEPIQELIRAHEKLERDHSRDIWTLLMFQTWYDRIGQVAQGAEADRLVG